MDTAVSQKAASNSFQPVGDHCNTTSATERTAAFGRWCTTALSASGEEKGAIAPFVQKCADSREQATTAPVSDYAFCKETPVNFLSRVGHRKQSFDKQLIEAPFVNFTKWHQFKVQRCHSDYNPADAGEPPVIVYYDRDGAYFQLWAAEDDGSLQKKISINPDCDFNSGLSGTNSIKYNQNTLMFVDKISGDIEQIRVFNRVDGNVWSEQTPITFNEVCPGHNPERLSFQRYTISSDSQSIACEVSVARLPDEAMLLPCRPHVAIVSRIDGQWVNTANFERCHSFSFSPDGQHIAIDYETNVCFMGKNSDGTWSDNGEIVLGEDDSSDGVGFSPDGRHCFITYEYAGQDDEGEPKMAEEEFYAIIGGLNQNGKWHEKQRVTRKVDFGGFCPMEVRFTPDSKHLIFCTEYDFDIWRLDDDSRPTPLIQNSRYVNGADSRFARSDNLRIDFTLDSSLFMVSVYDQSMLWRLNGSRKWACEHDFINHISLHDSRNSSMPGPFHIISSIIRPVISPDGKAIICANESGCIDIWLRNCTDGWSKQSIDCKPTKARFNKNSNLLAIIESRTIVLLALNSHGLFEKRGSLKVEGSIKDLHFIPGNRFIEVEFKLAYSDHVSIWQISPSDSQDTD